MRHPTFVVYHSGLAAVAVATVDDRVRLKVRDGRDQLDPHFPRDGSAATAVISATAARASSQIFLLRPSRAC